MPGFSSKNVVRALLLAAVCLASRLAAPVEVVSASPSVSLTVVPAIIDTGGNAGSRIPFTFKVTNRSRLVLPIHLSSRLMTSQGSEVNSFLQTNSAQHWLQFDEPNFILDSQQTRAVTGSLVIPPDTGPGGYYADIVVKPLTQKGASDTVHAQPELAVRLLMRISGRATERVDVRTQGPHLIMTNRPSTQNVRFLLENNGNVHELIRPVLHIAKGANDVATKEGAAVVLLPHEKREIGFTLPDNLTAGIYDVRLAYAYATPLKEASSLSSQIVILPFPPALLLFIPAALGLFIAWRYRTRLLLAARILAKGQTKR